MTNENPRDEDKPALPGTPPAGTPPDSERAAAAAGAASDAATRDAGANIVLPELVVPVGASDAPPTDSVRFELHSREAGSGQTLVLVHSFPADGNIFQAQLAAASSGDLPARVVLVDLPGFGSSKFDDDGIAAPEVLDVVVLAESLANLIVRLSKGPVVVGGVAIGGYVCIELAFRHPELVKAVILSGTKAAPDAPAMADQREAIARLALEHGSAAVADELAAQPFGPNATDAERERLHALIEAADPRGIAALVRGLARRPDPTPALRALDVPVLVIAGSADPFVPLNESERLAGELRHGRLVTLDAVGHIAPMEAPDAYNGAVATFLSELG